MAHQYKLTKTTLADIQTMIDAANEFAGNIDAAQSGLSAEIEEQRDHLDEQGESFLNSTRGGQIDDWLAILEEALDRLNSLGELLGDLTEDAFPEKPES